jgi:Carboxypeptidase regulatory-like domain
MTRRSALLIGFLPAFLLADDEEGTTRLTIQVNNENGKPVDRASVVVRFKGGRSVKKLGLKVRTSWELRTNQEGIVKIPPVPQGNILVQVIAKGYQTYGDTILIEELEHTVDVKLLRPVKQYSAHE